MEHPSESKPNVYIPFSLLPESRQWHISKAYRVRVILRQTSLSESGANFEIIDTLSLEPSDKGRRYMVTESGILKT